MSNIPRDDLRPEEPAEKAARERLEVALKRALWAQRASRSWAALSAVRADQPNL